jgi:hypothetical protein
MTQKNAIFLFFILCPSKKPFSPTTGPLLPYLPWDQRLFQWGLGQGTNEPVFLSPTKETL